MLSFCDRFKVKNKNFHSSDSAGADIYQLEFFKKSGHSTNGCMNECIVRKNIENKQTSG